MNDVVILEARRTPIGSFLGQLASLSAPQLAAPVIKCVVEGAQIDPASIDQVIMGNVLQAGIGQAPARQAAIYGGLPSRVGAITVHKVCGSGLRAIMDAANGIRSGEWATVIAGGMESMSNAPHLVEKARSGLRLGDSSLVDSLIKDGLWDPYGNKHMGSCAELCVTKYGFSRQAQDEFALTSYKRAQSATESGRFKDEITAVHVPQKRGDSIAIQKDEEPFAAPLEKMASLRPAFEKSGSITAANASKINDGAAALLVCNAARAKQLGKKPLARIVAQASHAQDPEWFTTAPAEAVQRALAMAGLKSSQIDVWEINEAFATVTMAAIQDLKLDPAKVNPRGGAVALGHPIGCSGARIVTTLLHTMQQETLRYGCATICIGGGEAVAVIFERM